MILAKARRAIAVPLSKMAVVIIREQLGKHVTHVFTYQGKLVVQVNTKAWRKALQRAGIVDFRWHDLRHTWASWHVQAGTPLQVLQELGGWESVEMVRRYAHLSSEHLAGYVDSLSALHSVGDESGSYDLATANKKEPGIFPNPLILWSWRWDSNPRPADYKLANLHFYPLLPSFNKHY
jgi:Phage integrase family